MTEPRTTANSFFKFIGSPSIPWQEMMVCCPPPMSLSTIARGASATHARHRTYLYPRLLLRSGTGGCRSLFLHLRCRCGCGRRRVALHLIGGRRRCGGGAGIGLLHLVVPVVLRLGIGGLGSLGLRRIGRIVRSRGGSALSLSRGRSLRARRAGGLRGALCHYGQGQNEHNERAQNDNK